MRDGVLQDYVVPICLADTASGTAYLRKLLGTAFFINNDGVFLTARHVIEPIDLKDESGLICGLNVKSEHDDPQNMFSRIWTVEYAADRFDVAIGKANFRSRNWFEVGPKQRLSGWKDVATMGYPEMALNVTSTLFNVHMRMLKGYVQRPIRSGEIPMLSGYPDCYELSFPITTGMSGSPLFTTDRGKQQLAGICIGSWSNEIVDHVYEEVDEDGKRFQEKRLKVEQAGLAIQILPLLSWKPALLGGMSLEAALSN